MNIAQWLHRRAALDPDRPALFSGHDCVADYGRFAAQARAVAGWLRARGVQAGDRVAILLPNCPDYLIAFYGIWTAGAVAVPINAKLHAREVAFVLDNSGTVLTLTTPAMQRDLRPLGVSGQVHDIQGQAFDAARSHAPGPVEPVAPDDLAWLFYTSGTTGRPKGVQITHRMLMAVSLSYPVDVDGVRPQDAILYAAPMSHGAGFYNIIHVHMGARHVCPVSGGFDPSEILDLAAHHNDVHMFAAPTMVRRLTDVAKAQDRDGQGLRTIVYGGGPMYLADIEDAVDHFGPIFVQIYGQGECPMAITALSRADICDRSHPKWRDRLASVGRAQSAVEVQIGDSAGDPVALGETGEIMVRGDAVMPGYWRNAEATRGAMAQGWLKTGDVGVMDADGYVTLQDRSKDMIVTGGSNVYPREVEEVLLSHPGVSEASVVGRFHPDWGEEVVAFVVGQVAEAELDALCLDNIARFKRPKAYVYVSELPKNNYGKVLKTALRAELEALARDSAT